jgi:hypothetical protein
MPGALETRAAWGMGDASLETTKNGTENGKGDGTSDNGGARHVSCFVLRARSCIRK